jgi:hypothetical protein
MSDAVRLDPASIEAIAEAVARLVLEERRREDGSRVSGAPLLTAAQVAERFGVTRQWVYQHAVELGAQRLGQGTRPRLRFNAETVAAALGSRSTGEESPIAVPPAGRRIREELHQASA